MVGIETVDSLCWPDNILSVGRNKLVINHLGKLFVTSDAATIIREVEVVHPAAKLLVLASQAQEVEVSDFYPCFDNADLTQHRRWATRQTSSSSSPGHY